ncbi:MAG: RNB domain-containing ribonuclease [Bacilli bacterium]|nr:RNB domain-containing ribonuclease [Bacilli bacterium]
MNIEKALRNYLNSSGPKVKEKDFFEYTNGDGNAILNVLFKLVDEEIEKITEKKALDRVVEVLKLAELMIRNNDGVNRKIIARKIVRLDQKMDRILSERNKKFTNPKKIKSEFNKVRRELERLLEINEEKDTKQYDFMKFLITETKNISYLEYTLKKMPALANVRDKNEVPLFRNLLRKYLASLQEPYEEESMYYENLISLLLSQKSFTLTEVEKRICLDEMYRVANQLSYNKKNEKKNQKVVEAIKTITEKIKGIDAKPKNIDEIAKKYKIHISFSPAFFEQISLLKEVPEGRMSGREEVTDYTVSMDKPTAIEIDDALSCVRLPNGNYRFGLHTPSILGYFPYHSPIVEEAIYRKQSIYLPRVYQKTEDDFNRVVPIFPYPFAAIKGSLLEKDRRLTRSYYFEITPEGEIVKEEFLKTITANQKRLSFAEADKIIASGKRETELEQTLQNLAELTKILDQKYQSSDLYEKVKENMDDYAELRVKKEGSENIVYQSTILVGSRVAEFFYRNGYPCIYRVHEVNEENTRKLQAMIDTLNETYGGEQFKNLYQLIEGLYPKGRYAMEGSHSGLNLDHYCHCTASLRRSADIVEEHALEVCYDQNPTEQELEELRQDIAEKIQIINGREAPIDYFMKEYQKKYHRR